MGFAIPGANTRRMEPGTLAAHAARYVELAACALAAAVAAGIPLGIGAARGGIARTPILALANAGRVIPGLALLTFVIPVLGFGFAPALLALTFLGIAPIAITTDVGLRSVPAPVVESARAMGLRPAQIFARVEWPLALPIVFSGVRTAATEVVAGAVLASFIGAGGLGDDIQSGLQADLPGRLWSAVVLIAAIAFAAEAGLGALARRLTAGRA